MEGIRGLQKKYCSQAMAFAIIVAIVFILFEEKAVGKGLILGTFFSIINFIIMGQLIPLKFGKSPVRAGGIAFLSIGFRFIIMALPLIISLKSAALNFFGVAAGLFMVQLIILFNHLILERLLSSKNVRS